MDIPPSPNGKLARLASQVIMGIADMTLIQFANSPWGQAFQPVRSGKDAPDRLESLSPGTLRMGVCLGVQRKATNS